MNALFKSIVLSVLVALPLVGQKSVSAIPPMSEIEAFPVMRGPLTVGEMAKLQVRPIKLERDWTGYNWYRERNRFVYETILAGQYVLVDTSGHVRYKASCGNRLVELSSVPSITPVISSLFPPITDSQLRDKSTTASDSLPGFFERNARSVWSLLGDGVRDGLWLLALLAGIFIIPLILYLLYRAWRDRNAQSPQSARPAPLVTPAPATPPVVVATPAPAVVVPAQFPSAPVSGTTSRRFVNFAEGNGREPAMVRFSGVTNVRFEESGGVATIRWTNVL